MSVTELFWDICLGFTFDKFANRNVVEILYFLPLYSFLDVLFLLGFQSQLDKYLLQFLIDKIYAELLEAVFLKNFKSINIQDTNVEISATYKFIQRV